MKNLKYILIGLIAFTGCSKSNAPIDANAYLAQLAAERAKALQASATPPTSTTQTDKLSGDNALGISHEGVTCQSCRDKCRDESGQFQATKVADGFPELCQRCDREIADCNNGRTIYVEERVGLSDADLERMDSYPSNRGRVAGRPSYNQYNNPYAATLRRIYCGNSVQREGGCRETINSAHHSRCRKLIHNLGDIRNRYTQAKTPQQQRAVMLELESIQPEIRAVSGKSTIGKRFGQTLERLKNAGWGILEVLGAAATGYVEGTVNRYAGRATGVIQRASMDFVGSLDRVANGINYLSYQNPNDPCGNVADDFEYICEE